MTDRVQKIRVGILVAVPLIGTLLAIVLFWNRYVFVTDLVLFAALYVATGLGITIGYHRMLTHESFQTKPFLKALFLILGCMAFEGTPDTWAATHTKHHAHSDQEGDPHSPLDGFWHAHFGWLFSAKNFPEIEEYTPHLLQDPVVQFVSRFGLLWMGLSLALPALLGGFTGFVWGGLVRIFLLNHVTWSVNSVCHSFGKRPFEANDESRNEWVVGLLGFGEGWHNNHHAFPRSAFHGLHWWQFDLSAYVIRALEKPGLVWSVQRVSAGAIDQKKRLAVEKRRALAELRDHLNETLSGAKEDLAVYVANTIESARKRIQESQLPVLHRRLVNLQKQYTKRLDETHRAIAHRRHVRKQQREAFFEEVRFLVERAKQAIQKEQRIAIGK